MEQENGDPWGQQKAPLVEEISEVEVEGEAYRASWPAHL